MLTRRVFDGLLVAAGLAGIAAAQDTTKGVDIHTSKEPALPTIMATATEESSSETATATTSSASGPATITIAVGAQGHLFTPSEAKANVGDIIKFAFYPGGHRVARAEFGWPCIPYELANIGKQGFYTGEFHPQVVSNDPPSYTVRVNDTEPIFFYCAAPGSCVDYYMIGVINPNSTHTLAKQIEYAKNTTFQLAPGEPWPSETPRPTAGPTDSIPGPSSSPDAAPADSGSSSNNLSAGAIAGIAIGGAAVLILAGALLYLCGRRGGFDKAYRKSVVLGAGGGGASAQSPMVEARYPDGPAGSPGYPPSEYQHGNLSPTTQSGFYSPHSPAPTLPSGYAAPGTPPAYYPGSPGKQPTEYSSPLSSPGVARTPAVAELPAEPAVQTVQPPGYIAEKGDDVEAQRSKA